MKEKYNHQEELAKAMEELNKVNERFQDSEEKEIEKKENKLVREVILTDGRKINFDFGKLTGNSIQKIKKEYAKIKKKNAALIEEFDDLYYMLVAEYGSNYPYEMFMNLPYIDFNRVRNAMRDFLGED